MKIVILGAGVVGVAAAWYLRLAGHDVQVLDRREGPGLETSFANGGQISADHAAPWAKPGVPLQALKWMLREDAPLLFRLRADPAQWRWALQFLRNCTAARFRANAAQLTRLGSYSRALLRELRAETGIEYDHLARGILVLYTGERGFEPGWKTPEECVAIEPAVASMKHLLNGGRYVPGDESGDAYKFTVELAKLSAQRGVRFDFETDIGSFSVEDRKISGVSIRGKDGKPETLRGDAYVLALGSYSPLFARPLGIDLPIYPLKGYSVTMPVKNPAAAWTVSLSDEAHKLVFARLGDRLRIAGTAELNGYNTEINQVRCQAIVKRTMELFPDAGDPGQAQYWAGLRPATPSNIPCIGRTKYPNLYLNTGHGTLGWTHACGSGRILADIVGGRKPEVDFAFTGSD
ncbi:MAG: amino acid dehydrogenase [Betaproteobacteria bacterium RBG_16_66_20]|nr:MAG: amino acid dehydrogenase [Betaproteobacteria bacterium RBG_16_66_20]